MSEPSFASLLNAPAVLAIVPLVGYPIAYSAWPSFHQYSLNGSRGSSSSPPVRPRPTRPPRAPAPTPWRRRRGPGRPCDRIPGARLEVLEQSGHTPQLEEPEPFHRLALPFLLA
jgi:hypothetical protein